MPYVYIHITKDTNKVFYVGIGKYDDNGYLRANQIGKRNKHWHSIYNKHGRVVQIVYEDLTWQEAQEKERLLISLYGRVQLKTGTLCNYTNGGEGSNGAIVSQAARNKISAAKKGVPNPWYKPEYGKKISDKLKGKTPKNFLSLHTPEMNKKRAAAMIGSFSEATQTSRVLKWKDKNPRARLILDTATGIFYEKSNDAMASKNLKIHHSQFSMMMSGKRKNKTSFIYA